MNKNTKKILAIGCLLGVVVFFVGASFSYAALPVTENAPTQNPPTQNPPTTNTNYQLNVPIPGLEKGEITLPSYIKAIYKFGIGVLAIIAMGMIMIGGYQYMFSAGENITKTGDAKDRIKNALIGLFIALTSFLLLNTINPDLLEPAPAISTEGIKKIKQGDIPHVQKIGQYCNSEIGPDCEENLVCDKWEKSPIGICEEAFLGAKDVKIIKETFVWKDCSLVACPYCDGYIAESYCLNSEQKKPTSEAPTANIKCCPDK